MRAITDCLPWPTRSESPVTTLRRAARAQACAQVRARERAQARATPQRRLIETAHYRYVATRAADGRLWHVAASPVSAGARHYQDARGEPMTYTCTLAALPAYIDQVERELAAYWGAALDTRRRW